MILMGIFEFPDILRESAEYRFNLYLEHQRIIVPVYYFLALTGIAQVVLSVLFYRILNRESAVVMLGSGVVGLAIRFIVWWRFQRTHDVKYRFLVRRRDVYSNARS